MKRKDQLACIKLTDYLKGKGESVRAFAKRTGIKRTTLLYLMNTADKPPAVDVAAIIHLATEGAVPITCWLGDELASAMDAV